MPLQAGLLSAVETVDVVEMAGDEGLCYYSGWGSAMKEATELDHHWPVDPGALMVLGLAFL